MGEFSGEQVDIPDSITPIVAYRVWSVGHHIGGGSYLASVHRRYTWKDGVVRAHCDNHGVHDVPWPGCMCGFYGLKIDIKPGPLCGAHLMQLGQQVTACFSWAAVGRVELWGTVLEGENGYRAQYARVKDFFYLVIPKPGSVYGPWSCRPDQEVVTIRHGVIDETAGWNWYYLEDNLVEGFEEMGWL